jgi:polyisoprenoid-binding protein YceI/rhodanese-related sulfurtransferase
VAGGAAIIFALDQTMSTSLITREELKQWLERRSDFVLIDTGVPEYFQTSHLPKAQNACVYDVDLLNQVGSLAFPDGATRRSRHSVSIVVYGSSAKSLASRTAAEKLSAAGYQQVFDYQGGLEEWQKGSYPLLGDTRLRKTPIFAGDRTVKVLAQESIVEWTGRSLTGRHHGTIGLRDGSISLRNGKPMCGDFVLDLQTIACTDIPDPNLRQVLIHHLQSEDFFDVARYSEARFMIEAFQLQSGATEGRPNYQVQGRLLLRGVERPVSFGAFIGQPFEQNKLLARAHFDIDRTEWGVLYGSGKFYEKLGKHLVNDHISLDLKIVAI